MLETEVRAKQIFHLQLYWQPSVSWPPLRSVWLSSWRQECTPWGSPQWELPSSTAGPEPWSLSCEEKTESGEREEAKSEHISQPQMKWKTPYIFLELITTWDELDQDIFLVQNYSLSLRVGNVARKMILTKVSFQLWEVGNIQVLRCAV